MFRFTAVARALAYAIAAASTIAVASSALAGSNAPILVASLNPTFTAPTLSGTSAKRNSPAANGAIQQSETVFTGAASFYDEDTETSSGEAYDPNAFTAAAQIMLRDHFGGIKAGKNYQPSFGVAEYGGKKAIIKFNDVGPLRPGRKFDFSRAVMQYFDGIELGVLPDVKVTLLPLGRIYAQGPVTDAQLAAIKAGVLAKVASASDVPAAETEVASAVAAQETSCHATPRILPSINLDALLHELFEQANDDAVGSIKPAADTARDSGGIDPSAPVEQHMDWDIALQNLWA